MPFKEHFGFNILPFQRNQPIESLFETEEQIEAFARLKYIAENKQFGILTAEPGTGKSTTLRKLAGSLNNKRYRVIYISDSNLTPRNFYTEALQQLGHEPRFYRGDLRRQLQQAVTGMSEAQGAYPVIITDEAHLFKREMYEELRFLLNFEMDSFAPMSLILSGQTELKRLLRYPIYEAVAQRINIRCHIGLFNRKLTGKYIYHHTVKAGAASAIFTDSAIDIIHESAQGVARKINNICSSILLQAHLLKQPLVDEGLSISVINSEFAA